SYRNSIAFSAGICRKTGLQRGPVLKRETGCCQGFRLISPAWSCKILQLFRVPVPLSHSTVINQRRVRKNGANHACSTRERLTGSTSGDGNVSAPARSFS